jgi:hypothetical protein
LNFEAATDPARVTLPSLKFSVLDRRSDGAVCTKNLNPQQDCKIC